jgi:2-oxoisovalerate dehydrogenase E1 component
MHRNLGVFTGRDIPLYRLFSQWQGKANGFTKGRTEVFILEPNNIRLLE